MTLAKRNGNLMNSFPGLLDDFFTRDLFDWGNSNFS
ncbi:MAG: Heat-shock protein, partial [Segetibacter sp.]|nr:Heat-shock protein [Segetibacter sp.]